MKGTFFLINRLASLYGIRARKESVKRELMSLKHLISHLSFSVFMRAAYDCPQNFSNTTLMLDDYLTISGRISNC